MAPAPYSAPSAYCFPTMARMESVEVRKEGAKSPWTSNGRLNMVSTSIPDGTRGACPDGNGSFATSRPRRRGPISLGAYGFPPATVKCSTEVFTGRQPTASPLQWMSANGRRLRGRRCLAMRSLMKPTWAWPKQTLTFHPCVDTPPGPRPHDTAHSTGGGLINPTEDLALTTEVYQTRFAQGGTSWTGPWTRWAKKCRGQRAGRRPRRRPGGLRGKDTPDGAAWK